MKGIFSRHGIPEKLVSDNMPFNSFEFRKFCNDWEVNLVTSSPRYPQSNGLAERYVQTMKRLLKKAKYCNNDSFLSLLEFRNTPISGMSASPAELLMSRKLRTRVPQQRTQLRPKVFSEAKQNLMARQSKQKYFYDRNASFKQPSLEPNDVIRLREDGIWKPATVVTKHDTPRSFNIVTPDGRHLRRNRRQLMPTSEPPPEVAYQDDITESIVEKTLAPDAVEPPTDNINIGSPISTSMPRRSTRIRRKPDRFGY